MAKSKKLTKKEKKDLRKFIVIILIVLISSLASGIYLLLNPKVIPVSCVLNGGDTDYANHLELNIGDTFYDPGFTLKAEGNTFTKYDTDLYTIEIKEYNSGKKVEYTNLGDIDTNISNTFEMVYSFKAFKQEFQKTRIVTVGNGGVVDNLDFSLKGDTKTTLEKGVSVYEDPGFNALYNNIDVSDDVKVTTVNKDNVYSNGVDIKSNNVYMIKYSYTYDSDLSLTKTIVRYVKVDNFGIFEVHFIELGNDKTGDSIYIKTDDCDILIDAGSQKSSAGTITKYLNDHMNPGDNTLEYVIATHSDFDHISGMVGTKEYPGILEAFDVETVIDYAFQNNNSATEKEYKELVQGLVDAGDTEYYNVSDAYHERNGGKRVHDLGGGVFMTILYQKFYDQMAADNNDHSVCVLLSQGDNNVLLTGDLEAEGERSLVDNNDLPKVKVFKAGHHGSKTSSNSYLLDVIQPEIVTVCCCAGHDQYTTNVPNQFPTQDMIDRVAKWTAEIYVTTVYNKRTDEHESMNGDIIISFVAGEIYKEFSNNSIILKDTEWFAEYRTWPSYGV